MRSPVESSLVCERTAQRFRLNMSVHLTKLASDYIESQHRLQDPEAHHSHIRRLEPSRLCGSLGHHVLHPLPGPAQLRSAQARDQHGSFPPVRFKIQGFLLTESFKHFGADAPGMAYMSVRLTLVSLCVLKYLSGALHVFTHDRCRSRRTGRPSDST